jgi:ubiquinone/menaquinone biosynthesis C-methylase UbiE
MSNKLYYQIAGLASEDFEANEGLRTIKKLSDSATKILDVGCGEGTRLSLLSKNKQRHGVDVNQYAIKLSKKNHPELDVVAYSGTRLPYDNEAFDLVYSAYVLEHTVDPYKVIDEMIRVTKDGANICLITPNFGSPNRRSPNSIDTKIKKLIFGLLADLFSPNDLKLTKVIPKKVYKQIDDDTTVEPYLRKLVTYGERKGLKVKKVSSLWEIDEGVGVYWKLLRYLGRIGIYPFYFWGPQAFVWFAK